jgi:prevent-host-death family protein
MDGSWSVAEAKAKLSEVIEKAMEGEPQVITRKGKKAVVVVSAELWEARGKREGTLLEFFLSSPARRAGALEIERFPGRMREVELD